MVYAFWHVEESTWVTLNLADMQKRREELRWDEVWSVKSAVWSVGPEECSVKCEVWSAKKAMRSVKCGVWSVDWGECSVKWEVSARKVWSVQCGVWRVQWEVWRAKWSFKCDMWNRTPLSQSARTHGLGWRTAHASSIDEKGLIYIYISLRQLPPRLVRVLLVYYDIFGLMTHWWKGVWTQKKPFKQNERILDLDRCGQRMCTKADWRRGLLSVERQYMPEPQSPRASLGAVIFHRLQRCFSPMMNVDGFLACVREASHKPCTCC